jgi:GT2 family glycosyltransferase
MRVVVADQSAGPVSEHPLVAASLRILRDRAAAVELHEGRAELGIAEQRAHLLYAARAPLALMLDDDVWLQPWAVRAMVAAIAELRCGFVGMAVQGLSYADDERPAQWAAFEPWAGPVLPERVRRADPAWQRWQLHNAANLRHLAAHHGATPARPIPYKVAWVGGCTLYDTGALRAAGGFSFWRDLPVPHVGEDVVAQLRVMERFGGAGLLPSAAVHLELPTTLPVRRHEAYDVLGLDREDAGRCPEPAPAANPAPAAVRDGGRMRTAS